MDTLVRGPLHAFSHAMGKKTRKRRKLSLKKQAPRRLENVDQNELAEVAGGYELSYSTTSLSTTTSFSTTPTYSSPDEAFIIRYTQRCETEGCK